MNLRISAALIAMLLAAFGLLSSESKSNPIEAARLNNLGVAYMNQQLFEKGLKEFQQAAEVDRKSTRLNSSHLGISYAVFCLKIMHRVHELRGIRQHNRKAGGNILSGLGG